MTSTNGSTGSTATLPACGGCGRPIPLTVAMTARATRRAVRCNACGHATSFAPAAPAGHATVATRAATVPGTSFPVVSPPVASPPPVPRPAPVAPLPVHGVAGQVTDAVAEHAAPVLGYACGWMPRGIECDAAEFASTVEAVGLDADLVRPPKPRGALKLAIDAAGADANGGARGRKRSHKAHKGVYCEYDDGRGVQYSLLDRALREDEATGGHKHEAMQVVTYSADTHALTFSTDYLREEIAAGFARYSSNTLTSQKIRNFLDATLDGVRAVPFLVEGVRFVPAAHGDTVRALKSLFDRYAHTGTVFTGAPLVDVAEMRRDVLNAAARDIAAKASALRAELDAFKARIAEHDTTLRPDTIRERLARVTEIREQVTSYSEAVGYAAVDVLATAGDLEQEARRLADAAGAARLAERAANGPKRRAKRA